MNTLQNNQYKRFTHHNVNYKCLNILNREEEIIKQAERDVKRKKRKYTGLHNIHKGDDLITAQVNWYVNHVEKNNIKTLNFFNTGVKAGKFELGVLSKLFYITGIYGARDSIKLSFYRKDASKNGYTINYIDVAEYKL